jgi:hypothetical protein
MNKNAENKNNVFNTIMGLLLVIGGVAVGIYLIKFIFEQLWNILSAAAKWLEAFDTTSDKIIVVALITGIASLISLIVTKVIDNRQKRREYLDQKREKPYHDFIDMIYKIQQNSNNGNEYTNEEMVKDLMVFSKEITLWGSPSVIKKWVKFRENGMKEDSGYDNLFLTEDIMNAMRKDLGLRKTKKGNLLAFFVNDIKEAIKKEKK